MEKHAVTAPEDAIQNLEANRAVVRGLLLPRPLDGQEENAFPRSEVMRFLLDARKRRLACGIFTAAWMFLARRRRS